MMQQVNGSQLTTDDDTELNVYDLLDNLAQILAFVSKTSGLSVVQEVLARLNAEEHGVTREFLEDAGFELAEVGLSRLAALVMAKAQGLPSRLDRCPYAPDSLNAVCWLRSTRQRLDARARKRAQRASRLVSHLKGSAA
jgi:hypothetical protein